MKKSVPSGFGKRWTKEEETELLFDLQSNLVLCDIAKKHDRTLGGIRSRIDIIAKKMISEGVSIDEVKSKTRLTDEQISLLDSTEGYQKKDVEKKDYQKKDYQKKDVDKKEFKSVVDLTEVIEEMRSLKEQMNEIKSMIQEIKEKVIA